MEPPLWFPLDPWGSGSAPTAGGFIDLRGRDRPTVSCVGSRAAAVRLGGYAWFRTGIAEDGRWRFALSGD